VAIPVDNSWPLQGQDPCRLNDCVPLNCGRRGTNDIPLLIADRLPAFQQRLTVAARHRNPSRKPLSFVAAFTPDVSQISLCDATNHTHMGFSLRKILSGDELLFVPCACTTHFGVRGTWRVWVREHGRKRCGAGQDEMRRRR
jgi:hypothetical protein